MVILAQGSSGQRAQSPSQEQNATVMLALAELDALSRSGGMQQHMNDASRSRAERGIERKRYTAALAERQFNRGDPDIPLVALESADGRRHFSTCAPPKRRLSDNAAQSDPTNGVQRQSHHLPPRPDMGDEALSDAHRMACCNVSSKRPFSTAVSTTRPWRAPSVWRRRAQTRSKDERELHHQMDARRRDAGRRSNPRSRPRCPSNEIREPAPIVSRARLRTFARLPRLLSWGIQPARAVHSTRSGGRQQWCSTSFGDIRMLRTMCPKCGCRSSTGRQFCVMALPRLIERRHG